MEQKLLQSSQRTKLLDVKSTQDKEGNGKWAHQKTQEEIDNEALMKMLKEKMNLIENNSEDPTNVGAQPNGRLYAGAVEDKLQARITKIFGNAELDNKEKITQMVKIYEEEIITGYEQTFKDVVNETSEQSLNEFLVDFTSEKAKIADQILQKYQVLSKEYQGQAKSFKEKHEEIKAGEVQKRDSIINNFETHYKTIKEQMAEDHKQLCDAEGNLLIFKENADLQTKYEEINKEIIEKGELMAKQIIEKDEGTNKLTDNLSEQLATHEEDMKKQIDIYQENIVKKKEEEAELAKVLKEYSERFKEFDKSTKQSRKTLGTYEKEIGNMTRTINKLKDQKKKVLSQNMSHADMNDVMLDDSAPQGGGKKNKKKRGKAANPDQNQNGNNGDLEKMAEDFNANVNKEIEEVKSTWEKDKFQLKNQKIAIESTCKEIQVKIKEKKDAAGK